MFNRARSPNVELLKQCGAALHESGHFGEALYCLDLAIQRDPFNPAARWHRSLCELALGRYAAGWADYEYRVSQLPEYNARPDLEWINEPTVESLTRRNVIVHAEQGIGDEIMFASCIPDLCDVAKDVRLISDARLCELFTRSFPCEGIFATGETVPEERDTLHIFAGSLPHAFRRSRDAFPGHSYLSAEPRSFPHKDEYLHVGFAWRGGTPETRGALRSLDYRQLEALYYSDSVMAHSLQHDARSGEYVGVPHVPDFADFARLARTIKSLDYVVTVQCSIAHLCGALGVPCLVLLSAAPEWRYGAHGAAMPWYSSVELARQERLGDWSRPLALARERVESLARNKQRA